MGEEFGAHLIAPMREVMGMGISISGKAEQSGFELKRMANA